jgi:uncharacterized protein
VGSLLENNRMRKKMWNVFIITCLLFSLGVVAVGLQYEKKDVSRKATVMILDRTYALEIADTDSKRTLGLGERDSLCRSCAMLFVFDRPSRYTFWMKGMRFPLDIVWLSGDEVVFIERNISADSLLLYTPDQPADRVLEFNAGAMDTLSVGDTVRYFR